MPHDQDALAGTARQARHQALPTALPEAVVQPLGIAVDCDQVKKLKVFYSYSHKDVKLLEKLDAHLSSLRTSQVVDTWKDGMITAGSDWRKEITRALEEADIVLLLVSSDFLNSEFCQSVELKRATERHETDRTLIIPILLRPCDIKSTVLEKFQCIPKGAKPVTEWANRDRAFVDIVERIRTALSEFEPVRTAGAAPAADSAVQSTLHRVFGRNEFQSPLFFRLALQRAGAVARLEGPNGQGLQTGCLVRLSDFGLSSAKDGMGILTVWYEGTDISQAFFELADFRTGLGKPLWRSSQWIRFGGAQIFAVDRIPRHIEPCPLGDPASARPDEPVFLISYPLGGPLALSVRDTRFVSRLGVAVGYFAATQPGSSGAPVFDDDWNLIGIHSRREEDGSKAGFSIEVIRNATLGCASPLGPQPRTSSEALE
jgi:hypothetical protein